MKTVIFALLTLFSSSIFSNTSLMLMNFYNNTRFIDYTSSRMRYDADIFGFRFGALHNENKYTHKLDIDISLGLSGRSSYNFFDDRPFYFHGNGAYNLLYDLVELSSSSVIKTGVGIVYNLEGFIPGDLYGPGLSWIQTIGINAIVGISFFSDNVSSFSFLINSPVAGLMNRPAWAGSIDKEIDDLSDVSYLNVLFNRGEFFSYHNYFRISGRLSYKRRISKSMEFLIEEGVVYETTKYPRYYTRFSNQLTFGIIFSVIN